MTSELWSAPPQFAAGQYFSAEMHGDALVDCTNVLFGVYKGPMCLWQTGKMAAGDWSTGYGPSADGYRLWTGAVRHKTNADTLTYTVRVWKGGAAQTLTVTAANVSSNTHTITAGAGYSDVTDTIDVSGVTADTFYEVYVDLDSTGQPSGEVLALYETDAQTYAALAAFTAGSTPSVAQWAALSTRASTLWQQMTEPVTPVFGAYYTHQEPNRGETATGRWTFRFNNRYLAYQIMVRPPGNAADQSYFVELYIDSLEDASVSDALLLRRGIYCLAHSYEAADQDLQFKNVGSLANGDVIRNVNGSEKILLGTLTGGDTFVGCTRGYDGSTANQLFGDVYQWQVEQDQDVYVKNAPYVMFRGVIDLDGRGLIDGDLYEITAVAASYEHAEVDGDNSGFGIDYLYQVSASTPVVTGWSAMTSFSRGTTVTGAGSIKPIRDNLTWLSGKVVYRNRAAPLLNRWGGWGVRQKRWLVYYCTDEEQAPELVYWRNTKEQETVGLTSGELYKWMSYDLDSAEGLHDGVGYQIRGVTYAMEDDASV